MIITAEKTIKIIDGLEEHERSIVIQHIFHRYLKDSFIVGSNYDWWALSEQEDAATRRDMYGDMTEKEIADQIEGDNDD